MKAVLKQLRALRRRFSELRYRHSNYRYWRDKGMSPRHAWAKADLTL